MVLSEAALPISQGADPHLKGRCGFGQLPRFWWSLGKSLYEIHRVGFSPEKAKTRSLKLRERGVAV